MKVFLVSFGKVKTPGFSESISYYERLLGSISRSIRFESIGLKSAALIDKTQSSRLAAQLADAATLEQCLTKVSTPRSRTWLLDEKGKTFATKDWASSIEGLLAQSISEWILIVGSSVGFTEAIRNRSHQIVSLGPQTLPHELARLVLTEQVYRALSVLEGHPYHNEGS